MKKIILLLLTAVLTVSLTCVPAMAEQEDDLSVRNGSHSADAQRPLLGEGTLVENAQSAILYDCNSDTLLYAMNPDVPIYPSSLVKIMTGLIAAEQGDPDEEVIATPSALSFVTDKATTAKIQAGEVMTLRDLMYCMLVSSANDAAAIIAEHISGSQENFVALMNQYAEELGCTRTRFMNSTGLHDPAQVSTARDMTKILEKAMDNELFAQIFYAKEYELPATNKSEERYLTTNNYLMSKAILQIYYDERVKGSRSGVIESGERNLASVAEENGMRLICMVIGAASEMAEDGRSIKVYGGYTETKMMLDAAFNGFYCKQVIYEDQVLCQHAVTNGVNDVFLGSRTNASAILPGNVTRENLTYQFDGLGEVSAPVRKGDTVCTVSVWNGDACVAQGELYAMNDVAVKESAVQDKQQESDSAPSALKVIAIVILIIAGLFVLYRVYLAVYTARRRRVEKKYRKYRRRSR